MKPRLPDAAVALLCFYSVSCHADLPAGDHTLSLTHQQRNRSYIVHVPRVGAGVPRAAVLNFHGGGGHAANQQACSHMDAIADQEGFLAVYPNGTGGFGGRLLTWNAGSCCGAAQREDVDDVGFTRAVIEDLSRRTPVDRTRIYATGMSNGGMMAYRLAVEASDLVAAIASVAGSEVVAFHPTRPMPIMHIHSVDDPRAPYAGGLGPPFPLTNVRVLHPSVEEVIGKWVEFNGCERSPQAQPTLHGSGKSASFTAARIVYSSCKAGVEVVLWKLTGSGHVWPGAHRDYLPRILGPGTDIIDASAEIWKFVSRFRRTP